MAGLVTALLGADVQRGVIALDDAHRIEDAAIFEFLDALIGRLPSGWAMVICSRMDPPLALARLRSHADYAALQALLR